MKLAIPLACKKPSQLASMGLNVSLAFFASAMKAGWRMFFLLRRLAILNLRLFSSVKYRHDPGCSVENSDVFVSGNKRIEETGNKGWVRWLNKARLERIKLRRQHEIQTGKWSAIKCLRRRIGTPDDWKNPKSLREAVEIMRAFVFEREKTIHEAMIEKLIYL
jgi:hypothetical protein